jgi:hypothetical protein
LGLREILELERRLALIVGMAVSEMTEVMRRRKMLEEVFAALGTATCRWKAGFVPVYEMTSFSLRFIRRRS